MPRHATRTPLSPATITMAEAARMLGIGREAMAEAVRLGHIPTIQLGRKPRVLVMPLLRMLDGRDSHDD